MSTTDSSVVEIADNTTSAADISMDWNTFSFDEELNTHKNIFKSVDNEITTSTTTGPSSIDCNDHLELDKRIELFCNIQPVVDSSINLGNSPKNWESLILKKKTLEDKIPSLIEEKTTLRNEYKLLKASLSKAEKYYTEYLDLSVITLSTSDEIFVATVSFSQSPEKTKVVKMTINRKTRKIIDFDASNMLNIEEERNLKDKFKEDGDEVELVQALRKMALDV